MPVEILAHCIHPRNAQAADTIVVECSGAIRGRALADVSRHLLTKTRHRFEIWDFSSAHSLDYEPDDVHLIARQDNRASVERELAAVAVVSQLHAVANFLRTYDLMARKWVGRKHDFGLHLAQSRGDAEAWLKGFADRKRT